MRLIHTPYTTLHVIHIFRRLGRVWPVRCATPPHPQGRDHPCLASRPEPLLNLALKKRKGLVPCGRTQDGEWRTEGNGGRGPELPRRCLPRDSEPPRSNNHHGRFLPSITVRTNICATNIVVFTMFMKTITLATFATGAMARSRTLSSTRSAIHNDGRRWFPLARPRLPVPCAVSHSLCLIYGCF
jgi:hypothetical protein